jgi:hypothetical protein
MLTNHSSTSLVLAVQDFYESDETLFVWKIDKKCNSEVSVEYPNLLIKRCDYTNVLEKRSVKFCSPISIVHGEDDNVGALNDTKLVFVISFDKLIDSDNCDYEYKFKDITSPIAGNLILYSEEGVTEYKTNDSSITIETIDNIGWFDIKITVRITESLCNISGFDYSLALSGHVNSYIKRDCHNRCPKQICNKVKINYGSYITLEKVAEL